MHGCLSQLPENQNSLNPGFRPRRITLSHVDNQTASLADRRLNAYDLGRLTAGQFQTLTDPILRPGLYAEEINAAVANRLIFEFVQYALAEGSGLTFYDGGSRANPDQVKGKPSQVLRYGNRTHRFKFQSAHAATQPRPLVALPGVQGRYAFLDGSSAYMTWNSTDELPKAVNDVDSNIDFRQGGLKLRQRRLDLINSVAQGVRSAVAAHRLFIREFKTVLQMKANCATGGPEQAEVTRLYLRAVQTFEGQLTPAFYDHCLSLHFDGKLQANLLRRVIYPHRQQSMRERNEIQSFLHKKFLDFCEELTGQERPPHAMSCAIRAYILSKLSVVERSRLEEFWCQTLSYYQRGAGEREREFCAANQLELDQFIQDCREYVIKARRQEMTYRSKAMKAIREVRQLSQEELGSRIGENPRTVAQLENGRLDIDSPKVKRLARALDVDRINLVIDI